MKVATDKKTSRHFVKLANSALVQVLKSTVARLHNLEMEIDELELADDDEVEYYYTHEADECHERIKDIDEFVRALTERLRAGEVPAVASALADMLEEREEQEHAIRQYEEACGWHERQFQKLQDECAMLKKERLVMLKTCIEF